MTTSPEQQQKFRADLCTIFNRSAAFASAMFPDRAGRLRVLSTNGETFYAAALARNLALKREITFFLSGGMKDALKRGVAARNFQNGNVGIMLREEMLSHPEKNPAAGFFVSRNTLHNVVAVFDHEMGHVLTSSGLDPKVSTHQHECAAEAYAILRHLQRYPGTDIFTHHPKTVAAKIFYNPQYYLSVISQRIEQLARTVDIAHLTPQDTVQLADAVARDYHFSDATLKKIHDALAPVYDSKKGVVSIENIFTVMKQHAGDDDIYRAIKLILPLYQDKDIPKDMTVFMEKHERETGVILNLADAMDAARAAQKPQAVATLKL